MSAPDQTPGPASPTAIQGVLITGAVITVIVGWIVLGSLLVGATSLYASFLFGWYWISVEEGAVKRWLPCVTGALVGLGFAWLLHFTPLRFGALSGSAIALIALAALIYLQVMALGEVAVNRCTMMFATVLTASDLLMHMDFSRVAAAILSGALYLLVIIGLVGAIQKQGSR